MESNNAHGHDPLAQFRYQRPYATCPLCELEQRYMEPYTALESDGKVSCLGCGRTSSVIPHELRAAIFSLPQDARNRVAELMSQNRSAAEALAEVTSLHAVNRDDALALIKDITSS